MEQTPFRSLLHFICGESLLQSYLNCLQLIPVRAPSIHHIIITRDDTHGIGLSVEEAECISG